MEQKNSRQAGVLLPISALPSRYGVGDLGPAARKAADLIAKSGASVWQILPLNPLGFGNSPYQPYSSYAGDPLYLSLELLHEEKLLEQLPEPFRPDAETVDYEAVRAYKDKFLRKAFSKFMPDEAFKHFASISWVKMYAVFITFKQKNQMRCWNEWPDEEKNWPLYQNLDLTPYQQEIWYQIFLQYEFLNQWTKLKKYANHLGLKLMGDMPFYVGIDSLDVWNGRENFLLDADGRPTFIAGVPPDYFSPTGQRWGNPIYNWEKMEKDGFSFWCDRLRYSGMLFDIVRIDHFRAFDTYWKIPVSCPTAVEGEWIEGPAYRFFDAVLPRLNGLKIAAEDLGDLRPEVLKLRDHYKFPGMVVVQFTFQPGQKLKAPECSPRSIVYTGTHDNQTIMGWYNTFGWWKQWKIRRSLARAGCRQGTVGYRFLTYALKHPSELAIIPAQDIMELDDSGRINTPGTLGSPNWEWKMADFRALEAHLPSFAEMISRTGRAG